jgi:glycosyltransferase involved in cell wall biosynthesis
MKRILLLTKGLGRGGAEQIVLTTVRNGDRARFEYEVAYLLPHKDALVPEFLRAGAPVHRLDGWKTGLWVSRLDWLVRRLAIDVVHAHAPVPAIGARILPKRYALVYTEHNVWSRYARTTYWANAATFGRNDHVFAVSDEVRSSIRYPAPLRKRRVPPVETLHHGIDETDRRSEVVNGVRTEFGVPTLAPFVVTVANLKKHKGYRHLIDAIVITKRSRPDARFLFVGTGPLETEIRQRVKEAGLEREVILAGFRDDARRIVDAADIFVLASEHEGLPLSLLEAMSSAKPAVVTRVGGIPEVVTDGEDALVVPPANPLALADALTKLMREPALRKDLGQRGRRRARAFDAVKAVRRIEQVYEDVAHG